MQISNAKANPRWKFANSTIYTVFCCSVNWDSRCTSCLDYTENGLNGCRRRHIQWSVDITDRMNIFHSFRLSIHREKSVCVQNVCVCVCELKCYWHCLFIVRYTCNMTYSMHDCLCLRFSLSLSLSRFFLFFRIVFFAFVALSTHKLRCVPST